MIDIDEENYKEAIEASFKVSTPRGISKDWHTQFFKYSYDLWVYIIILYVIFHKNPDVLQNSQ